MIDGLPKLARKVLREFARPANKLACAGVQAYAGFRKSLYRTTDPVLIACFPKSGSTYLSELLCKLTGLPRGWLGADDPSRDQDAYEHRFHTRKRSVIQQHAKATIHNLQLFTEYNIRPIVLTRNIFDVVPSVRDHWLREGAVGLGHYIAQSWFQADLQRQHDFIIRMVLPWYFHFYVSWLNAVDTLDTLWITYKELFKDQHRTVKKVLEFYSIDCSDEQIQAGIEWIRHANTRLNKGVIGRGQDVLTREQKQDIRRMAECWGIPLAEFSRIGICEPKMGAAA